MAYSVLTDSDAEGWLKELLPLAINGDLSSQMKIAYAYYRVGNLNEAEHWYKRAAENGAGDYAILQLVRALIENGGDGLDDLYDEKSWDLAAIDVAYVNYRFGRGMSLDGAVEILKSAAEKGSIAAKIRLHFISNRGVRQAINLPRIIPSIIKYIIIGINDKNDSRILH